MFLDKREIIISFQQIVERDIKLINDFPSPKVSDLYLQAWKTVYVASESSNKYIMNIN